MQALQTSSRPFSILLRGVPRNAVARRCTVTAQARPCTRGPSKRPTLLLGIESSCDDTGAAVVSSEGRVLGEDIAGQADIHAPWGGVVPNLAMVAHKAAIDRVVAGALSKAGVQASQLDGVAVTVGPGLSLCLRVGVVKAMAVAAEHRLPLIRVHHMEAHALVARLKDAYKPAISLPAPSAETPDLSSSQSSSQPSASHSARAPVVLEGSPAGFVEHSQSAGGHTSESSAAASNFVGGTGSASGAPSSSNGSSASNEGQINGAASDTVPFPFLCLLVSGGHNLVVLVKGVGQYVQLGTTVDDALGEAFDKVARLLSLDLKPNGGAALERLAKEGDPNRIKFKIPMRKYNNANFSFAGLKTSVRMAIDAHVNNAQPSSRPGEPLAVPTPSHNSHSGAPSPHAHSSTSAGQSAASSSSSSSRRSSSQDAESSAHIHAGEHASTAGRPLVGVQIPPQQHIDLTQQQPGTSENHSQQGAGLNKDSQASTSGRDPLRQVKADIAASFQHVATVHLVEKLERAIQWVKETDPDVRHLVVAGGVACNQHIRGELMHLAVKEGLELVLPPPKWCTDNGTMVAWAGHERMALGLCESPPETSIVGDDDVWVDLLPRWPLTSEQHPAVAAAAAAAAEANSSKRRRMRAAAASAGLPGGQHRGERKARLHTSLTEMTASALAEAGSGVGGQS